MKMAITGHRPSKFGSDYEMKGELAQKIKAQIEAEIASQRPSVVYTGMALGVDQLMAYICIAEDVPFIAAIPHVGQHKVWPVPFQQDYLEILSHAAGIMVVDVNKLVNFAEYLAMGSTMYLKEKMDARNKWMVDQLNPLDDELLAVWDGTPGGTGNCVKYAQNRKKKIVYINPKTL